MAAIKNHRSYAKTTHGSNDVGLFAMTSWRKWLFLLALWTLLGMSESARLYFRYNVQQVYYTWSQTTVWGLSEWYVWGILSPLIVHLASRVGFHPRNWLRRLMLHILCGIAISLAQVFLDTTAVHTSNLLLFSDPGEEITPFGSLFEYFLRFKLQRAVLTYFLIAFVSYSMAYYKRYHDLELRRSKLEAQLAHAQLQTLKGQLHPHFLFNALNAVTALIHTNPEAADQTVTKLSTLLRATTDATDVQEVPLHKELAFQRTYLDIQKVRFGDRLNILFDIADDCMDAMVPSLILQPLVENSIKHALDTRIRSVTITIKVQRAAGTLSLEVADDGPGITQGCEPMSGDGVGLRNTNERLVQLYGDSSRLHLHSVSGRGLAVSFQIPYHLDPLVAEQ